MTRLLLGMFASTAILASINAGAQSVSAGASSSSGPGGTVATSTDNCKTVHLRPGMSSSVTAGGGHVSGSTSGPNSVTVHSGNGSSSSSVTTSGSGGSTVVVGAGTGNCTIYVTPPNNK